MAEPLTDSEKLLLAEARRRLEPEGWSVKLRLHADLTVLGRLALALAKTRAVLVAA